MLVLSRRLDESIVISAPRATEIKIRVVRIRKGTVRIGLDAPADVKFLRSELTAQDNATPPEAAP